MLTPVIADHAQLECVGRFVEQLAAQAEIVVTLRLAAVEPVDVEAIAIGLAERQPRRERIADQWSAEIGMDLAAAITR
ncbi:hypothetical protein [Sphingomonas faeni]|uniref:hypothetical protein n=1 Tax=Sphingomonas faeni TaxID=185950 RepID=UPI0033651911